MRRFFSPSPFPDGRPGVGLLVLRTVAALAAIGLVVWRLAGPTAGLQLVAGAVLVASSVAVLVGVFTVGSAALLAAVLAWLWLPAHPEVLLPYSAAALITVVNSIVISLLGPGAFSLDARLFGPREIVVPRDGRGPRA